MSFGRTFWRSSDSRWCWCHSASGVSGNNLDDKQMTIRYSAVIWLALGAILQAQAPPPQGTPAAQLPLSGRGGQGGSVNTVETPVPGVTSSVNTLNTSVQVQGPYAGSVAGSAKPFSGKLSLREAVGRALEYNLGTEGLTQAMRQARGQARVARSSLLPNLNGYLRETVEQENLAALGLRIHVPIPGFSFPTIVGPFNYYDLRATLTQTVADLTALNNYRSARELVKANEAALRDARDLVVLAAGGAYLQVMAAEARVRSAQAQIDTAQALFKQTQDRRAVGLNPQMGADFTAKDFRTWGATLRAIALMAATPLPESPSERALNECIVAAVKKVATELRNTAATMH